ncbi:hypothetical protein ACFY78_24775 [Streptomyces olindensis]|uniref:hypothetical protein n=1 Tax=Streptomyces olindensis TaxID=358823 RepID=UPI00367E90AD
MSAGQCACTHRTDRTPVAVADLTRLPFTLSHAPLGRLRNEFTALRDRLGPDRRFTNPYLRRVLGE